LVGWRKSLPKKDEHEGKAGREEVREEKRKSTKKSKSSLRAGTIFIIEKAKT
jgi:hypothetical protein